MTKILRINEYAKEIEQSEDVGSPLLDALTSKDCLIEIIHGQPPYDVVIGVPHQAAVGVNRIADEWVNEQGTKGRDSDEGAAFHALVAFTALRDHGIPCKLVIAAHDTQHDSNKKLDSPYCKAIFSDELKLLFECHGAGERREYDLELSSGSNKLGKALDFGKLLAHHLDYRFSIAAQVESGKRNAKLISREHEADVQLALAANNTLSLQHAGERGVPALHLEAKPRFRIPPDGSNTVTPDGLMLGRSMAKALIEFLTNPPNDKQGA